MPENNCPPPSATRKDIDTVYRLVLHDPPEPEDFLSHVESGRKYPPGSDCAAAAISVYKLEEDALNQKKRIPAYKKRGLIAKGCIKNDTGVIDEAIKDSHVSWWIYKGKTVHNHFNC